MSPFFFIFLAAPSLAAAPEPTALEAAATRTRLEAIAHLEELLRTAELDASQRSSLLFRLAELTYEHARALHMQEMDGDQTATESVVWRERAIKRYQLLLRKFPTYERADEATWFLGRTLSEAQRAEEGNAELLRLVKTWPQSKWAPDAYVQLGEYAFDHDDAYKAMAAYGRAMAWPDYDKHAFARYKFAWCLYNLGQAPEAVAALQEILESEAAGDPRGAELHEEVVRDYVRFYADTGEADLAGSIGRYVSAAELAQLNGRLADVWTEQGKFEQAILLRRHLLADAPQAPAAFGHAAAIAAGYAKMGKNSERLAMLEQMDRDFGPGSRWAAEHPGEPAAQARASMAKQLHELALANQRGDLRKVGPLADRAYTLYLSRYADEQVTTVHFEYAELLWKLKRFDEAYEHYLVVVRADPNGKDAKFCAESAIFAAEEMTKRGTRSAPAGTAPIALTEWEQKELAAIDLYAAHYSDAKLKNILYKSAWLLYQKNQFTAASDRFTRVIQMDPSSREAEQAADLIMDSLALVGDWDALQRSAKVYAETEGLGSPKFREDAYHVYENASFQRIAARLAKDGDRTTAANAWLAYASQFSANADLALHNAAFYLDEPGQLRASMAAREQLVSRFPSSKYTVDAVAALGFAAESIADFGAAAARYEQLAALDPTHASAPDALYSAGVIRAARGEWQAAVVDWQRYTTKWPDRPNVVGVPPREARWAR